MVSKKIFGPEIHGPFVRLCLMIDPFWFKSFYVWQNKVNDTLECNVHPLLAHKSAITSIEV